MRICDLCKSENVQSFCIIVRTVDNFKCQVNETKDLCDSCVKDIVLSVKKALGQEPAEPKRWIEGRWI